MIIGIDEVGRGAWAGPLCVAAVGLGGAQLEGLSDSKKLTKKRREALNIQVRQNAPLVGIGWVSASQIDRIGMSAALSLAARKAVAQLDDSQISQIIVDGTMRLIDDSRVTTLKQADLLVPSVSAASVVAKVARDSYMSMADGVFPGYGFDRHVGYGTALHQQSLESLGVTPLHRMSFAPMCGLSVASTQPSAPKGDGANAEESATQYLAERGFDVLDRNWKTKWCEIDIIACLGDRVHFVEVKYRKKDSWGDGLTAITPKKLRQMRFAAELWMNSHSFKEVILSVVSVSGDNYAVDDHILIKQ